MGYLYMTSLLDVSHIVRNDESFSVDGSFVGQKIGVIANNVMQSL